MTENPLLSLTFQETYKIILESMLQQEQNGNYVQAENLRLRGIKQKKRWEESTLNDMNERHDNHLMALQHDYSTKLAQCNKDWKNRLDTYIADCRRQIDDIDNNNKEEISQLRKKMDEELPTKVKESYQLLNLRQMQLHMSKQKNFTQAHLIQQRIKQVYQEQLNAWNTDRNNKIQQAATNLKNKHEKDRDLLNKKIQIQLEDYNNQWHLQKISIQQRYNNQLKQLKANHQRENLSFKKQFTTKGGVFNQRYLEPL